MRYPGRLVAMRGETPIGKFSHDRAEAWPRIRRDAAPEDRAGATEEAEALVGYVGLVLERRLHSLVRATRPGRRAGSRGADARRTA